MEDNAEQVSEQQSKRPGGRPTLYSPDMPDRLRAYIRECPDELPAIPGFAVFVGVCEKTIHNWGDKNPGFLLALNELHAAQHQKLLNNGLLGSYNSTIAKLILSSNHGYKERSDQTSGDEKLETTNINIIAPQGADVTGVEGVGPEVG